MEIVKRINKKFWKSYHISIINLKKYYFFKIYVKRQVFINLLQQYIGCRNQSCVPTQFTLQLQLQLKIDIQSLLPNSAKASQPIPGWGLRQPYYHSCGEPPYTLRHPEQQFCLSRASLSQLWGLVHHLLPSSVPVGKFSASPIGN